MKKIELLKDLFLANNGLLTIQQVKDAGFGYYQLNELIARSLVNRISSGIYHFTEVELSSMEEAGVIVPEGILCLFTAAAYHELTTFISSSSHVAIHKKRKVRLPDYPPIKLYYWKGPLLELGVMKWQSKEAFSLKVYDREKTICDFFKFRNQVGIDLAKEVLKNYLLLPDRNIVKLMDYAKALRLGTVLPKYLEILI